jgi:hypothetical protein
MTPSKLIFVDNHNLERFFEIDDPPFIPSKNTTIAFNCNDWDEPGTDSRTVFNKMERDHVIAAKHITVEEYDEACALNPDYDTTHILFEIKRITYELQFYPHLHMIAMVWCKCDSAD